MGIVLVAILVPIGVVLFILLLVYLFGNVYNGLSKRRSRVEHSWYELSKSLKKSFDLIPSVIQNVSMSTEDLQKLKDIYSQYQAMDLKTVSPSDACLLVIEYQSVIDKLLSSKKQENKDSLDYVKETMGYMQFSIPLYNHIVRDYLRFKHMFINKTVSKIFKFEDAETFTPNDKQNNTTLDFRIQDFIKDK